MPSSQVQLLEQKIDELIRLCDQLNEETKALKSNEAFLLKERSRLIEKNEQARLQVEGMISRLKALEQNS